MNAGCRSDHGQPASHVSADPASYPLSADDYAWPRTADTYEPLAARIAAPRGHARVDVASGGFAEWLRHLPVLPDGADVVSESGDTILRASSRSLAAVIDIDVRRNQECADTNMRVWSEYLKHVGRSDEIAFKLTGGGTISWPKWKQGYRLKTSGNSVSFVRTTGADGSRASFDKFLASVFGWCGTLSLSQEGSKVAPDDIAIGDFFVHGGSPGHTVMVVDIVVDDRGRKKALLLQGYMPAQSAHVLAHWGDPWFDLDTAKPLDVPRWREFEWDELRRF